MAEAPAKKAAARPPAKKAAARPPAKKAAAGTSAKKAAARPPAKKAAARPPATPNVTPETPNFAPDVEAAAERIRETSLKGVLELSKENGLIWLHAYAQAFLSALKDRLK
jgi:hypothetical protein